MVVIDGFSLLFLPGGIKSYLLSFLTALNTSKEASENTYVVLIPKIPHKNTAFFNDGVKELEQTFNKHITFHYVLLPSILFHLYSFMHVSGPSMRRYTHDVWEKYVLPRQVKKLHPTTVFHPYQVVSTYKTSSRKVVVVHDAFQWVENQDYSFLVKKMYNSYKRGCESADTLITISQTSKKEIMKYLTIDEKKVVVCYEGVDDIFLSFSPKKEKAEDLKIQYHLPDKYLFALVSAREYKNIKGVLYTYAEIARKDPDMKLVLAGWALRNNSLVTDFIKKNTLEEKVILIPSFPHEDLLYFYHLSFAFLFLSLKEGFGLPPLEAVICETLPIVSNVSAVGEIYDEILPTFPPAAYQEIAAYIATLKEGKREDTIKSARKILLEKYTWEHVLPSYLRYIN